MKRIAFVALVAAISCRQRVALQTPAQVDAFHLSCAAGPCLRSFTTSVPPAGDVTVTRNGLVLYSGPQHFDYAAAADAAGRVTVTFTAQPTVDGDLILLRYAGSTPQPPQQNVQFVKVDTTTQGSWSGVYGADGYYICADSVKPPTYGAVSIAGQQDYTWAQSTSDVRALQKAAAPADRIAAAWYSYESMSIDVNLTDGAAHQIAVYSADYDRKGRSQRVEVLDAGGAVADTRDQTPGDGQYLVWQVRGHVTVRLTNLSGGSGNAVVSGVFLR